MCIIIDTNLYGEFGKEKCMEPLKKWIGGGGKIVYSLAGDIGKELNARASRNMKKRLKLYSQMGRTKLVSKKKVEKQKKDVVDKLNLKSNDPYIIALAQVSNTRLLTSEDSALCDDFKEIIGGKIYKAREHKKQEHLLNQNRCP